MNKKITLDEYLKKISINNAETNDINSVVSKKNTKNIIPYIYESPDGGKTIYRRKQQSNIKEKQENCICCGKRTNYWKFDGIDDRRYYVEGAGQLCQKCWNKIYEKV